MYNIEASIGDLNIIKSATAHIAGSDSLILKIEQLEMEFRFLDESNLGGTKIEREIVNNRWIWKLTNFRSNSGEGMLDPFKIGILEGKDLYCTFWIQTPDYKANKRVINYVLSIKGE